MRVGRPNPSEIVKRLVEIGATRLTEDAGVPAEQARFVMREVAHEFCAEWGGDRVYLPKDVELPLEKRDREIWERFNGTNAWELSRDFNLTHRQVRYILKHMRKRAVELNQRELPGLDPDS